MTFLTYELVNFIIEVTDPTQWNTHVKRCRVVVESCIFVMKRTEEACDPDGKRVVDTVDIAVDAELVSLEPE